MIPETDPGTVDRLVDALQAGDVSAIAALVLLLLAPAVTYVTHGKLSTRAESWVSLIRGLAVGLASGMVAASASGGPWWIGCVTGGMGLLASAGFLDLVRALIPDRRASRGFIVPRLQLLLAAAGIVIAVAIVLMLSGCTGAQDRCRWERATVAVASSALDEIDDLMPESEDATRALAASREALDLGNEAVTTCEDPPAGALAWVAAALRGVAELLDLLKAAGVPIPGWVSVAVAALAGLGGA